MARTLFFPMALRKLSEITNSKPILTSTVFFLQLWIFLFSIFFSLFDLFSIIAKEANKIRNNLVFVAARLVFLFCCVLTTGRCNAFQHIFVNYKKPEFNFPYFQTMEFLLTMCKIYLWESKWQIKRSHSGNTIYISVEKKKLIMNSFFKAQFNYYHLIWMLQSRSNNNKIKHLQDRRLRLIYNEKRSSYEDLLKKDGSVPIHHKNIQGAAIKNV